MGATFDWGWFDQASAIHLQAATVSGVQTATKAITNIVLLSLKQPSALSLEATSPIRVVVLADFGVIHPPFGLTSRTRVRSTQVRWGMPLSIQRHVSMVTGTTGTTVPRARAKI